VNNMIVMRGSNPGRSLSLNTKIYRKPTVLAGAPSLVTYLDLILKMSPINDTLRKLYINDIPDTATNREICFWRSPIAISWTYILAYTIFSTGIKVNSDNPEDKEIVEGWCERINESNQDIYDLASDTLVDNHVHNKSVWRILYSDDNEYGIDLARLDPLTVAKVKDPVAGYECYVQAARKLNKTFYTSSGFFNWVKSRAPMIKSITDINSSVLQLYAGETQMEYIVVPNKPDTMMEFEFFRRPPVSALLDIMADKRWVRWYMRNFAEREWSPIKVGYTGDPNSYMPEDDEEFKRERDMLLESLINMRNFGAMATPGYNKVEILSKSTAKSSQIFIDAIHLYDEQIMLGLMGSMGLRSTSGTELATSKSLDQQQVRYIQGLIGKYKNRLEPFFRNILLPRNGRTPRRSEFSIRFPPTIIEKVKDLVEAVGIAADKMFYEDWNEPRQILQGIWGSVMDELDPAVAKKLQSKFEEMNSTKMSMNGGINGGQERASTKAE